MVPSVDIPREGSQSTQFQRYRDRPSRPARSLRNPFPGGNGPALLIGQRLLEYAVLVFRSRTRDLIFPQAEHGRLSAVFAANWGNAQFSHPAVDRDSFVRGVLLHDRAYGAADDVEMGATTREVWTQVHERDLELNTEDPICDLVSAMHVRRLITPDDHPDAIALGERLDARIQNLTTQTGIEGAVLRHADSITELCDSIAYDACFQSEMKDTVSTYVAAGSDSVAVSYRVRIDGTILVTPWPFAADRIETYIVGYAPEDYGALQFGRPVAVRLVQE